MENENQNLINLNEDINNQSENNLNNTHSVDSICINESLIAQDEKLVFTSNIMTLKHAIMLPTKI